MMKFSFQIVLICVFCLCSCNEEKKPIELTKTLEGNWYYFDPDTMYHEVYFLDDNEFRFLFEDLLNTASHKFIQDGNKIYTYRDPNEELTDENLLFEVLTFSTDSLLCINSGDTVLLRPLNALDSLQQQFLLGETERKELLEKRVETSRVLNGFGVRKNSGDQIEVFGANDNF